MLHVELENIEQSYALHFSISEILSVEFMICAITWVASRTGDAPLYFYLFIETVSALFHCLICFNLLLL